MWTKRVRVGLCVVVGLVACRDAREPAVLLPTAAQRATEGTVDETRREIVPAPHSREVVAPVGVSSPPSVLSGIIGLGSGSNFSCALRNDGLVYCWGSNAAGVFGNGSIAGSLVPVETSGPQRFARLAVGDANVCGLTVAGAAYCWGDNVSGQVGTGIAGGSVLTPTSVSGGHTFTSLSIGLRSICGLATDGLTYCWGNNSFGQLGVGLTGGAVAVPTPVVNSASLGFTAVSAGFNASCALTVSGATYCWGTGGPAFGNGPSSPSSNVPVPAAGGRTFAHLDEGSLYACAITMGGRVGCWGAQAAGELGSGSFISPVGVPTPIASTLKFKAIDANTNNSFLGFSCGLLQTGQAWCWGSNEFGQLGATGASSCVFNATTFNCSAVPLPVVGGRIFTQVAVGVRHTCALEGSGNVYCWGDNSLGQLGNNSRAPSQLPVRVVRLASPPRDGSMVLAPLTETLVLLGESKQFTATLLDESGAPAAVQPPVRWFTSDPAVATVNQAGLVTAVSSGSVVIRASTANEYMGAAPVQVNIVDPVVAFQRAWSGAGSGAGASDGLVAWGGLLTDEWLHSGTFPTRLEVDRRAVAAGNSQLDQLFASLKFARRALDFETARLLASAPADPRIGHLRALAGYVYIGLAEAFCSSVPLDDPNTGHTTSELLILAEGSFMQALAGPIAAPHDVLAKMGVARARLGRGDLTGAVTYSAQVPPGFTFATLHSPSPGHENWVFSLNGLQRRLALTDREGGNGLPFRSALDPRLPWVSGGLGFDAFTPYFNAQKYTSVSDPIVFASATEARLIEAEALLRGGNFNGALTILNTLRAAAALPPLVDPGTTAAREDLLFSERSFWLFATGSRLGDVRRLITQYGRAESSVLPAGSHHKGGLYGTDANFPVPTSARGPSYAGCTDRSS